MSEGVSSSESESSESEPDDEMEDQLHPTQDLNDGCSPGGVGEGIDATLGEENVDYVADTQPMEVMTQPASDQLPGVLSQVYPLFEILQPGPRSFSRL
jgi:hypothetical protein